MPPDDPRQHPDRAATGEGGWNPPVGASPGRAIRYELIGCALNGHCVPLMAVGATGTSDPAITREHGGVVWHRCLRCDAWLPGQPSGSTVSTTGDTWSRDGTEPPLRGRLLRDRYVLRLIAVDRALHVLVLSLLAAAILLFASHRTGLKEKVTKIASDLQGGVGGQSHSGHGLLHDVNRLFSLQTSSLYLAAAVATAYAVLEAVEMVGLWRARRWAEYLTFLATVLLLPLEIYELSQSLSPLKMVTLAINLAIAAYLLWAKRLFGVHGGGRAEQEERDRDSGWLPIDRATPPVEG